MRRGVFARLAFGGLRAKKKLKVKEVKGFGRILAFYRMKVMGKKRAARARGMRVPSDGLLAVSASCRR